MKYLLVTTAALALIACSPKTQRICEDVYQGKYSQDVIERCSEVAVGALPIHSADGEGRSVPRELSSSPAFPRGSDSPQEGPNGPDGGTPPENPSTPSTPPENGSEDDPSPDTPDDTSDDGKDKGGVGNPGNHKDVGNAGENPNGKGGGAWGAGDKGVSNGSKTKQKGSGFISRNSKGTYSAIRDDSNMKR